MNPIHSKNGGARIILVPIPLDLRNFTGAPVLSE